MNHSATLKSKEAVGHPQEVSVGDDVFSRDVHAVLGVPIDAIDMAATVARMQRAARAGTPFLVSTVNLNFLVASQDDEDFRQSLIASDLCVADGMPVLWIARLLGLPIRHRVAGSDLLQTLEETAGQQGAPFSVFFFGGQEGGAEQACRRMNAKGGRLRCVGALCPGFGTLEDMSSEAHIDTINASKADFLVVALGARKGQAWLQRNHARLQVPVRSHLGATVNFQAGTLRRAPPAWQRLGLEWLWRIKEEPQIAGRYWHDGLALLRLLFTHILPLAVVLRWNRFRQGRAGEHFTCERRSEETATRLVVSGVASAEAGDRIRAAFRQAVADKKRVILDLAGLEFAEPFFFGLLLLLRTRLRAAGFDLAVEIISRPSARLMYLGCMQRMLAKDRQGASGNQNDSRADLK